MANQLYDLYVSQGVKFSKELQLFGADSNPLDLTGTAIRLMVRPTRNSTTILLDISTVSGEIVITDATNGIIEITLGTILIATITESGLYDMQITFPDASVTPEIIKGYFILKNHITRD